MPATRRRRRNTRTHTNVPCATSSLASPAHAGRLRVLRGLAVPATEQGTAAVVHVLLQPIQQLGTGTTFQHTLCRGRRGALAHEPAAGARHATNAIVPRWRRGLPDLPGADQRFGPALVDLRAPPHVRLFTAEAAHSRQNVRQPVSSSRPRNGERRRRGSRLGQGKTIPHPVTAPSRPLARGAGF